MESLSNPFVLIPFLLTLIVISLSIISIRIQKNNKLQRSAIEQSKVHSSGDYSAIGVYFQSDKTLIKCPSCAELINIEAKICKSCATNIENYSKDVQHKLDELNERNEQIRIREEKENAENTKKSIKTLAIVIPSSIALFLAVSFVSKTFFPSDIKQLAGNVQTAIENCGFEGIKVTINNESDSAYEDYAFEATGKFKATPVQVKCLKESLDAIYKKFNEDHPGTGRTATYFIGNAMSGSWNNDYAGPEETYTLNHEWY